MNSDGLIGLAPKKIGSTAQDLFVVDLYNQGKIQHIIFSVYLGTDEY
jgi:hypothetical protein